MQSKSDAKLLRQYAEQGVEAAFAELVARHTNLVYSAALRQVESADLAAEVSQVVFIGLAQGASELVSRIASDASLGGWLCRSARNVALNIRRTNYRRYSREKEAMQDVETSTDSAPEWEKLGPVLDKAMSELKEDDYDALVLRFYQNQNFQSLGNAMGISNDTAQKRVSRALEKLRGILSDRGIKTSAAALSLVISTNAVHSAPMGLAANMAGLAVLSEAASPTSIAVTATKTIAMTTLQKTVVTTTLALALGSGFYEAHQAGLARKQLAQTTQQQSLWRQQSDQILRDSLEISNKLVILRSENEQLKSNQADLLKLRSEAARLRAESRELAQIKTIDANGDAELAAKSWVNRASLLKLHVEQTPGASIPELRLATDKDWLNAAEGELGSEKQIRQALSAIRSAAENKVANIFQKAVESYMKDKTGKFPDDISQLQPYLSTPLESDIMQRWMVTPATSIPSLGMGGDFIITQKGPVDAEYDHQYGIGPNGFGSSSYETAEKKEIREALAQLRSVISAYTSANGEASKTENPAVLLPYAKTPEDKVALQKLIQAAKKSASN